MNIAIDVMGGDYAPEAVVDGILLAISNLAPEEIILAVGPADTINEPELVSALCVELIIDVIPDSTDPPLAENPPYKTNDPLVGVALVVSNTTIG